MSATTQFQTDRYGDETNNETATFAGRLQDYTNAKNVVIHDAARSLVGYTSKMEALDPAVFKEAYRHGFIPINTGRRFNSETNMKLGYIEFLPVEDVLDPEEVR